MGAIAGLVAEVLSSEASLAGISVSLEGFLLACGFVIVGVYSYKKVKGWIGEKK